MNYGDNENRNDRFISIGNDENHRMWLRLQEITGIYQQNTLLKWIDRFCAKAEELYNLPKARFNCQVFGTGKGGNQTHKEDTFFCKGEKHRGAKLTDKDISIIRQLLAEGK